MVERGETSVNITNQKVQTLRINGEGADKVAAFSAALNSIQKQVLKDSPYVTLRIEPKEVVLLSGEEIQYTERFLFFFFPRVRKKYRVELQVKIEVLEIQTNSVPFTVVKEQLLEEKIQFLQKNK